MIHCSNLTKDYKSFKKTGWLKLRRSKSAEVFRAVDNITFDIGAGEVVGYIGPNGAGKSTTIKMMCGILTPTSGELTVNGLVPYKNRQKNARQIGVIFGQKSQLWWDLPASDSFYLNKCIFDVDDGEYRKTVEELAELLDVKDLMNVQVRRLSLGERMKMEILAALIHRPRILFLDEPTIGLDILSQQKIRDFLRYYNEQTKTTIILTSHYMRDIEELCSRAVIINQGQLVYDGQLADLSHLMGDRKLLTLMGTQNLKKEQLDIYGRVRELAGARAVLEVPRQALKETASSILSTLPVQDFTVTDIPLEESIALMFQREVTAV